MTTVHKLKLSGQLGLKPAALAFVCLEELNSHDFDIFSRKVTPSTTKLSSLIRGFCVAADDPTRLSVVNAHHDDGQMVELDRPLFLGSLIRRPMRRECG